MQSFITKIELFQFLIKLQVNVLFQIKMESVSSPPWDVNISDQVPEKQRLRQGCGYTWLSTENFLKKNFKGGSGVG